MIHNLSNIEKNQTNLQTEVCIVGAGAAGISLALAFEKLGMDTVLLEGGGLEYPSPEQLELYDAKVGEKPYPVASSRLRYFGGSTNHWGGWSRALDDFDFNHKPYFSESGWPISRETIHQYYPKAAEICEIPNFAKCHNGYYQKHLTKGVIDWQENIFTNKFFVFSPPTRFGSRYLEDIRSSQHISTYLNATATELVFNGKKIEGLVAKSLNGKQLKIEAKHTILAMGGLENARFMLNNQSDEFTHGVGNHADWLGRCFMDHPGFQPINLLLPEGLNYKRHLFEEQPVMPVLSMTTFV